MKKARWLRTSLDIALCSRGQKGGKEIYRMLIANGALTADDLYEQQEKERRRNLTSSSKN